MSLQNPDSNFSSNAQRRPARLRRASIRLLMAAASVVFCGQAAAKTVRLLTVGNSFSQNATKYLDEIATANGDTLIHEPKAIGGATFEVHWKKVKEHEANPKEGRYSDGRSLLEALTSAKWDYITIQQASIRTHNIATYRPHAKLLHDFIKQHAPGAEVLMHQTWEYRVDDPRFAPGPKKAGEPATADEMYQGLVEAYATCARELGIRIIPVGDAFHLVNRDPVWGFKPLATPPAPTVEKIPEQPHSLNVGWNWKKQPDGSRKLNYDGHHANLAGEYLGACVWYEVLFGRSAVNNPYIPAGLDPEFARFLQQAAHRAVEKQAANVAQKKAA